MTQNLQAPPKSLGEAITRISQLEVSQERLTLRYERMADFVEKLRQVIRQQQLQISHDRQLIRAALLDRVSSVSPELLLSQLDALSPGADSGIHAAIAAMEGWND